MEMKVFIPYLVIYGLLAMKDLYVVFLYGCSNVATISYCQTYPLGPYDIMSIGVHVFATFVFILTIC
jgi:hypothetical protein